MDLRFGPETKGKQQWRELAAALKEGESGDTAALEERSLALEP